tara:strand:+ start:1713 stop:3542 length:1830 start_codon:yes stop_codon:yes gene_type:complete
MSRFLKIKLAIVIFFIFIFGLFILYKLVYISKSESNSYVTPKILYASRGDIYSCNFQLMSTSPIMYNIGLDPVYAKTKNKNFNKEIVQLSVQLENLDYQSKDSFLKKINKCIDNNKRYLSIKRHSSISERMQLKNLSILNKGRQSGYVEEVIKTKRFKPNNNLASKVLGRVDIYDKDKAYLHFGEKLKPRGGIEQAYDYLLRGKNGYLLQKKLKNNVSKTLPSFYTILPKDGKDIITTIDLGIQELAHNSLLTNLKKFEARFGTVIVMEVKTGEIKAIVNLGTLYSNAYEEDWNYAVLGNPLYDGFNKMEPGSTFKIASYMSYFEDGGTSNDTINTFNGIYKVPNTKNKIIDSEKNLGVISIRDAFATSSNVAVARIILKKYYHDPEKFIDRISNFGLLDKTGVDLNNEFNPYIVSPNDKNWSEISLPWMSYGYGINLSPLQILVFYNSLANNGFKVTPKLVTHYINDGDTIKLKRKGLNNLKICSDNTLQEVNKILKYTVTHGTAKSLNNLSVNISGKTGTTVTNYHLKNEKNKTYQSSFVGYFPSEKPKYSCIVLIDKPNPEIGYYGSDVAIPVFKEIVQGLIYNDTISIRKDKKIDLNHIKENYIL